MPRSEQELQQLLRNVASSAEEAPWDLTGTELRAQGRAHWYHRVDPKSIAVLVVAAALIVVVFSVVGGSTEHKRQVSGTAATTTTAPTPDRTVVVPAVTGMTQAAAITTLGAAGLIPGRINPVASALFPAGTIVASDPSAGTAVAFRSPVNISVSSGPPETQGSTPATSAPTTVPVAPVPTTPTTSAGPPLGTLQTVVTSVTATSLAYNPAIDTGGIPAEQVTFTITGIVAGGVSCSATVFQGGATVGSASETIALPVSTQSTTVSESINVSPLSVSPFDGSPSDAQVTCTS